MSEGHRRLVVVRGPAAELEARALDLLARLVANEDGSAASVVWVGPTLPVEASDVCPSIERLGSRQLSAALGRTVDVLVFDARAGVDADALAAAHGLVRGGGVFVLGLAPPGVPASREHRARFAAYPHEPEAVGQRFALHFERALARARTHGLDEIDELEPPPPPPGPASEQAALVERLVARWAQPSPTTTALVADRGRGKSSALGLALARVRVRTTRTIDIAVSAVSPTAIAELARFAGDEAGSTFVPLPELCFGPRRFDLIIIDEAAQLPATMLRRVAQRHADSDLAFATTTHGYEGTGRGFELRFLAWLAPRVPDFVRLSLDPPIRWTRGDPLERFIYDALLLDARPAAARDLADRIDEAAHACLDRDALATTEAELRALFGLLVGAHYRTTPRDLQRLLDAPNLEVHVLRIAGRIVAASLVAREGQLPAKLCAKLARGQTRIRAHALADNLITHLGQTEAGRLRMVRSVRIVVDPALRRRGLATRLVEAIHEHHGDADLIGTLFGATAELVGFRQQLGYQLVRVSASRGARTGEPAAMMLRPASSAGRELVADLRRALARSLDAQLALIEAEGETLLEPALVAALHRDLPPAEPLSDADIAAEVRSYTDGARTLDSVIVALRAFVHAHRSVLADLAARERALIEARVLDGQSWRDTADAAGFDTVAAAMRATRPAVRALLDAR